MLAVGVALLSRPAPAHADNPVGAALIGAGGAVVAAGIIAVGTVAAAVVTTYGGGEGGGDEGEGQGEGEDMVPGTGDPKLSDVIAAPDGSTAQMANSGARIEGKLDGPRRKATLGERDLDPRMRSFADRNVKMVLSDAKDKGLAAKVKYEFEGDVMEAGKDVASFSSGDVIEWQFDMRGPGPLPFEIADLTLSTTDVPGTFGYSSMVITATQAGKTVASWQARVEQGKQPSFDPIPNKKSQVDARLGALHIDRVLLMIPVQYDANNEAKVTVTMRYEGSGQRLPSKKPASKG